MQLRLVRLFIFLAAILLFATAAAKILSGLGDARVLQRHDPIFGIPYRHLFFLIGFLELAVSLFCFFGKRLIFKSGLVAWLSTCFLLFHLSLPWVGYKRPCPCLGNLTGAIHLSPVTASNIMRIVLIYLLMAGWFSSFWLWVNDANARIVEFDPKTERF